MKVGLLTLGHDGWVGGVYYVSNLARALSLLPPGERPEIALVYLPGTQAGHYAAIEPLALSRVVLEGLPPHFRRPLADRLRSEGVDCLYPCPNPMAPDFDIPWVAWACDLQHRRYPEFFAAEEVLARDRIFEGLAAEARVIVVSSRAAETDLCGFFPRAEGRVRVLPFASVPGEGWFRGDADAVRVRYGLPRKYLILPNQFWVHKNHRTAFEAVRALGEVTLVCTGLPRDDRRPEHAAALAEFVREFRLEERIRVLGLLPRADQIQLVRAAAAVVQPSLFEGWSTVVEDARALGKRVFLSDIPVHREQDPPGAVYFDPLDAEALEARIAERWGDLPPGPVAAEETAAREAQPARVAAFARKLLEIAREAVG